MRSYWEYTLRKNVNYYGGKLMTLDSILANLDKKERCFELSKEYKTIRYIDESEYKDKVYSYVEPEFQDCKCKFVNGITKFILFSAPGATGKTALAKYICYKKNGIYWDLPDNKIAEYSFQGAITKAVGFENISNFIASINNNQNFLVIDAFDEAEAGSGRTGVEFFLRDLDGVTKNCLNTCAILLARTESAIFIKHYFESHNIVYKHYEVGYFAEYNSKTYIENKLRRKRIDITSVVKNCIEEQFNEIHRIFDEKGAKEFLGYAPVLDALAVSYSKERNTANLLKSTSSGENNCSLIVKILKGLLEREQDKFVRALKNKFSKIDSEIDYTQSYELEEQIYRIIGMLLFSDPTMFGEINNTIPVEYHDEYLETVNIQLPQHPFILAKDSLEIKYEFMGPAFKDFVVAYGLANEDISEYVKEFLVENHKYCPSQLLVEFYNLFSNGRIKGENIPLMYNSFKAHAHLGDNTFLIISGDKYECYVQFRQVKSDDSEFSIEFEVINLEDGIYISQLSDCYIDIAGKVYIGNVSGEARINNSVIICDELVWSSEQILIEAYSPGESMLIANTFVNMPNINPMFEIKLDNKKNLKTSAQNIEAFYKLLAYKDENVLNVTEDGFESFAAVVRRIFTCLRCHSKDTPARKVDFIDNRIIGVSDKKKKILGFLLSEKILYTDEQDWLYKLDIDRLSDYAIVWNNVKNGDFSSVEKLYEQYCRFEDK